ncbi:MAG TPA: hypothetical protein VFI29_15120, partial [Hanamia sp.]|nr:hypothetical protein [Hanamia sp.]
ADGYKLPIMGNLFTAINRGYHGDIGGAVKPGIYFGIDVVTIPAGGEGAGGEMVLRSLDDLSSLHGATWDEAETLIPKDWIRGPMKKGEGIKFVNPSKKGEQILLEKGWPGSSDPLHVGPYMKVSRDGKITRIPLAGNPVLNP